MFGLLHAGLRGGPCRVFASDIPIVTKLSGRYADVVVTCDERDTRDLGETALHYPKLIVEVLSESSAAVDRGDKLDDYRTLESLHEYVLIDSRQRWVATYRHVDDMWQASLPVATGALHLHSDGITLALDDLYRNLGLEVP